MSASVGKKRDNDNLMMCYYPAKKEIKNYNTGTTIESMPTISNYIKNSGEFMEGGTNPSTASVEIINSYDIQDGNISFSGWFKINDFNKHLVVDYDDVACRNKTMPLIFLYQSGNYDAKYRNIYICLAVLAPYYRKNGVGTNYKETFSPFAFALDIKNYCKPNSFLTNYKFTDFDGWYNIGFSIKKNSENNSTVKLYVNGIQESSIKITKSVFHRRHSLKVGRKDHFPVWPGSSENFLGQSLGSYNTENICDLELIPNIYSIKCGSIVNTYYNSNGGPNRHLNKLNYQSDFGNFRIYDVTKDDLYFEEIYNDEINMYR